MKRRARPTYRQELKKISGRQDTVKKIPLIIESVQAILANPDSPDVPRLEAEINNLVYALYGLTPKEIVTVEGNIFKDVKKNVN